MSAPTSQKTKRLIRIAAGILLAATLIGAIVYRIGGSGRKPAAGKEPESTEAPVPAAEPSVPEEKTDTKETPAADTDLPEAESAGEIALDVSPLLPMEQSENPRVVGSVEITHETKEETP